MPDLEDLFGGITPPPTDTATLPEPTQAAPVAPVQPSQPAQAQAQGQPTGAAPAVAPKSLPPALLQRIQSAGLKPDGIDSHERLNEYLLDQYLQTRPYADYGRSALAQPGNANVSGYHAPEQAQAEPEEADQFDLDGHFSGLWSAPQLNTASQYAIQNGLVQLGDSGLYEAAPGMEALALPLLNELNQAHVAQKQQMQKLFEGNFYRNIYDNLLPALRHELGSDFSKLSQESVKSYEQQAFEEKFIETHRSWLYDPSGQLSPKGQEFQQAVYALRQNGMTDPQQLADWATLRIGGVPQAAAPPAPAGQGNAPAPATQATNGQEKPRDEHGRFLPAGTPAPLGPPPTKQESFIDSARKQAAASSNQGSYTEAGGDYVVANEGELENMFDNAWRKHKAGAGV